MIKILESGQPLSKASKALILLHGRGSSASRILGQVKGLYDDSYYIAVPNAPDHIWYPNYFMDEEEQNEPYLSESVENVQSIIDAIAKHIPKKQIYILGFSQGACLALETTARSAAKYGGIIAFSGGLIGKTINKKKYQGSFKGTKVFMGCSEKDPYIPITRVKKSKEVMEELGAAVTLKVYKGNTHEINEDEIDWVKKNILSGDRHV